MTRIAIVDYGMGNLASVAKALQHVAPKATVTISHTADALLAADRIVLPGQGAMPDCMRYLRASGLQETLLKVAQSKPLLGVCVGEQMLFDWSAEGEVAGLGLLPGKVIRFPVSVVSSVPTTNDSAALMGRLKIPHMGWNRVHQTQPHALWQGIENDSYFYFVHSYFVVPADPALCVGETNYGAPFTSVVARDNIFATQCHPEKSAAAGLRLYENFVHWTI